jgi:hypothetical protein
MQEDYEKILDLIEKMSKAAEHHHSDKIRCAKKAIDILNEIVTYEAKKANSLPQNAPGHMSWNDIGKVLEISKTAAFARYGKK